MTTDTVEEIQVIGTPPDWILRVVNPILKILLRSPLQFLGSDELMLITVTGRKSSTDYTFPVQYELDDGVIRVESHGTNWWKNLHDGGQEAHIFLWGEQRSGYAEVTEDDRFVAEYVHEYLYRYGWDAASRVSLKLPDSNVPPPEQLEEAVNHIVIIIIEPHETRNLSE